MYLGAISLFTTDCVLLDVFIPIYMRYTIYTIYDMLIIYDTIHMRN